MLCRVVDNFGDAGVCWRLARQLAREHGLRVALWIDRPEVLARLAPFLRLAEPVRFASGGSLRVVRWPEEDDPRAASAPLDEPPDVLIGAFGCEPPPAWRARLAGAPARPLWVNLEYLSAETWVGGCHALASIKPSDGAREHFFFPGFREDTGGLLREAGLARQRARWAQGGRARRWWRGLGLPETDGYRVSVFCYPQADLVDLLEAIADGPWTTTVVIAAGVGGAPMAQWVGRHADAGGLTAPRRDAGPSSARADRARPLARLGALDLWQLPMLPIDRFDHLLWSCDLNLVRGEDSWVRALWAARPFAWQPYRQADAAHEAKRRAYIDWQRDTLRSGQPEARRPPGAAGRAGEHGDADEPLTRLEAFAQAWSEGAPMAARWHALAPSLPRLAEPFERLARHAGSRPDLARALVEFCRGRL